MDPRSIPDDIAEIGRSLLRFVAQEVEPLERANAELLASERTIYDASGRFVPEVLGLRAEVRGRNADALRFYRRLGFVDSVAQILARKIVRVLLVDIYHFQKLQVCS